MWVCGCVCDGEGEGEAVMKGMRAGTAERAHHTYPLLCDDDSNERHSENMSI